MATPLSVGVEVFIDRMLAARHCKFRYSGDEAIDSRDEYETE